MPDNSDFDDRFDHEDPEIKKNRIRGIETESQETSRAFTRGSIKKNLIIVFSIAASAIITILVIVTFLYKKPGSFLPASPWNPSLPIGEDNKNIEVRSDNPHILRGKESYSKGFFNDAIAEFDEVVESDASDKDKAIALTYLGMISDERKEYDRAIEFYNRAVSYDGKNAEIYRNLALTYRHKKDYKKAINAAEKSLDINDKDVNTLILIGNINFETSAYEKAIKQYEKALEITPENPPVLYNIASAFMKTGDEFSAIEYLKKAGTYDRIGEVAHKAYSKLGAIYTERKNFADAEKYLKLATDIQPGDPTNHYNLGIAYMRQNKKDEALSEFVKAEQLGEQDAAMLENLGETYLTLRDYDRSLNLYNKLLTTNSRNVKILSRIAELYYEKKELDKALSMYERVTQIEPGTENARIAWLNIGNILDDTQQYDEAIEAYKKALLISEKDDVALYNLGIAYKHAGRPELAVQAWKRASELNKDDARFPGAIADYYYDKQLYDLAEKEYQRIVSIWPSAQDAHFKLATIYYKRGNFDYALKAYNRVLQINEKNELGRKALVNAAMLKLKISNDDESMRASIGQLNKALVIEPGDTDALFSLGIVYFKKEMYEKAIDTFYQVVRGSSEPRMIADAYNNIGKCYYQQKQYKKALQAFTRGLEEDPTLEEARMNRKTAMQAYEQEISRE